MVLATSEAEGITLKSGLGVVDLLRPLTLSTYADPYQFKGLAFRFVDTNDFSEVAMDVADRCLAHFLTSYDCLELAASETTLLGPAPSLAPPLAISTTWIDGFREQLGSVLRNSVGVSLDCPLGCILVASAAQPQPIVVFNNLLSAANLNPIVAESLADPGVSRTFVLLHDLSNANADASIAQSALVDASRAFGASACHLLTINSRTPTGPLPRDIWAADLMLLDATQLNPRQLFHDAPIAVEDVAKLRELIEGPLTKQVDSAIFSLSFSLSDLSWPLRR